MGKKMSKKQIMVMLLVMVILVLLYLAFSGCFVVNSSYKDVLSTAKHTELAAGDGWTACLPEKDDLMCYFVHEGDKKPRRNIHAKAVFYVGKGGKTERVVDEWYPTRDRHFFLGERRYCFPWYSSAEDGEKIENMACKIVWSEHLGGETYSSYLFSKELSEDEKRTAMEDIDDIVINENDQDKSVPIWYR